MTEARRRALLRAIRTVHSTIFLVMLGAIGWLVGTGVVGRRDRTVGLAVALIAAESAVFVANRGVCPLTPLAERYGANRGGVSDIFLPDVVARTIPIWSTTLIAIGIGLHWRAFRVARRRVRRSISSSNRTTSELSPRPSA